MDEQKIRDLTKFAENYQNGLLKLKACAEAADGASVSVLTQDESKAVIQAIRDSLGRLKNG